MQKKYGIGIALQRLFFYLAKPIPTIQRVNKSIQPAIRKIPQKTAMI